MEALPTMPMMAPQFRTSTLSYDNIPNFDFRLRMKEHILLTFNADPHEYDAAFDELAQMKFEANIPAASVEQILKLKRYYGQLCMMQKRFPMGAGEQLETPFAWHDGLVDMRSAQSEVTICDIEFEKASVMFNIGACHAQYAADQPRDTQDSIKTAFSHFQQAATAFEQLNTFRNSDFFYPSVDLDANVITFYYNVLVAQAQECIVQKSLLENRNPLVTAKLSLWLHESYEATTKIVDDWSVNIPESVQRYYAKLCRLKSDIYGVIAYMALGDKETDDKRKGWQQQYYNISSDFMCRLTMQSGKMRERYPELYVTYSFLNDVITAKHDNAKKENDFIYHGRIPKKEEAIDAAKKEGSVCKVTVPKFNPLDPSVCGADLFEKLLPAHVQDANNKYSEKKEEILREMKEIVRTYDEHLNYQLQLADFDKLKFMLNEGKNREAWFQISEDLMKRNADMTAYPDCVPNLIEKMRESADTARVAEAKLNTLLAKLRAIDLPHLKAKEGFNLIQKELERLAGLLEEAKTNNVQLNKAIATHSGNLQLLTLTCGEMWHKIVPKEEETGESSADQSPEEAQMRKMVAKVEEMQKQRHNFLVELAAELKADDIATKLMGTNERGAEEIMSKEILKHTTRQSAIRLNVTAQEAILRAFADANADFHEERSEMSKKKLEYDRKVNELCASYEVFRDVAQKCEEGETFFRQLMARCDQFAIPVHAMEEQYREELEKKERAKKEAEQHLNQIRMNREAQNALMDFGGAPRSPAGTMGPSAAMGPPGPQFVPPGPRGQSGQRGPRLGDYLDSYRARKQNPQVQIPQEPQDHYPGPPSPTPSSICDFPASARSQRLGPPSPYPASQANPNPSQYGGLQGPSQGYGGPPTPSGPYAPPGGTHGYPGPQYQPAPYQAPPPLVPGTAAYQQATSQYPGPPSSYSVSRAVPATNLGPQNQRYGPSPVQGVSEVQGPGCAPTPVHGRPGVPPLHNQPYNPSPIQGNSRHHTPVFPDPSLGRPGATSHPQYNPPSTPGGEGLLNQGYSSSSIQEGQGGNSEYGFQNQSYAPSQAQQYTSLSVQGEHETLNPQFTQQGPHQGYGGIGASQVQNQQYTQAPIQVAPPPVQYQNPPQLSQVHPSQQTLAGQHQQHIILPMSGLQSGYQTYAPPPQNSIAPTQFTPTPAQRNPGPQNQEHGPSSVQGGSVGPGMQNQGHGPSPVAGIQGEPGAQTNGYGGGNQVPPQQPSYQPFAPPAQPVYQHPPQGAPISAPPPTSQQHHQHVIPSPAPSKFQPTSGAPSPWHATPAELKTPWNTTPQYHAPPPVAVAPSTQPTQSNVDLLSDLLGDFNLQPTIQPSVQNFQSPTVLSPPSQAQQQPKHYQGPPQPIQTNLHQQDFRAVTSNQPDPPTSQPLLQKQYVRPAAAVQPMPQQPPSELSQIAQQSAQTATETPILIKGSPSLTELSDPMKFQMGEGNTQKLEKRLLHQSFRNNGPPPPLNQSDPLNQIDAFSFASITRQK